MLQRNGRTLCENQGSGPHLRRDADGLYRDRNLVSEIHPLGEGSVTCSNCNRLLDDEVVR